MKRVLLIIVALIAILGGIAVALRPELFTSEGRRARFLRSLERGSLVVRRSCSSMETFVQEAQWRALRESDQERAGQVLAEYCQEQGSGGQMTILDAESKRKLAHWDGSAFQRF
jgi:hypothetical protein